MANTMSPSNLTGENKTTAVPLKPVGAKFATTDHKAAEEIVPLKLKLIREKMVEANLYRKEVNRGIKRIRRMFKWAVRDWRMRRLR